MTSSKIKIESGIQMLARLNKKTGIEKFYPILFGNGPKHGEVIELYSESDTSYVLTELICEALMPIKFKGPETAVIIFKTDGNLDFNNVSNLLRNKMINFMTSNSALQYNMDDIDTILISALKNVHLLEIFDATQFYITIQNLEYLLTKYPNISLVIFHTLTAFYWSEQDFKITKMDSYINKLLGIIYKVVKDHKVTVLYTKPEYFGSSKKTVDNLESCYSNATEVKVNYRMQFVFNNNGLNVINVRTYNEQFQKEFNLVDERITWL